MIPATRFIIFHKQATSARTRFLRVGETVCHPQGLPRLVGVNDLRRAAVVTHPAVLAQAVGRWLGLAPETILPEPGFREEADVPGGTLGIYLVGLQLIDPPFTAAEQIGGRFVDLTQARDLAPAELELLRRAYVHVMG